MAETLITSDQVRFSSLEIGSGLSLDPSAVLQLDSTTQGSLLPRLTTTQRNAIPSPAEGLLSWNTTTHVLDAYNGTSWGSVAGSATPGGSTTQIQYNSSGSFAGSPALTFSGTTIRFGTPFTGLPTSDVHTLIGNGARAFNINLSEDPVYLEIAGDASAQAAIGFSTNGNQKYLMGKTPHGNFALIDRGVGAAVFYVEDGTAHVSIGHMLSSDDIFSDRELNVYGVMEMRGTGATQAVSANEMGTIYFDNGNGTRPEHFLVSEDQSLHRAMALILRTTTPGFEAPVTAANQIPYMYADSVLTGSSNLTFNGTALALTGPATFQYQDGNQSSGYVLTSDASGNATWQTSPTGAVQAFTSSGTFTVPTDVYTLQVTVVGAGGGGGGGVLASAGEGGGGGGTIMNTPMTVSPGMMITVTVGTGGSAGTGTGDGTAGTSSSISVSGISEPVFTAGGGSFGRGNRDGVSVNAGPGGAATVGTSTAAGGNSPSNTVGNPGAQVWGLFGGGSGGASTNLGGGHAGGNSGFFSGGSPNGFGGGGGASAGQGFSAGAGGYGGAATGTTSGSAGQNGYVQIAYIVGI